MKQIVIENSSNVAIKSSQVRSVVYSEHSFVLLKDAIKTYAMSGIIKKTIEKNTILANTIASEKLPFCILQRLILKQEYAHYTSKVPIIFLGKDL